MESLRKRFVDKYGMDAVDLLDKVHLAYPEHINSKTLTFDFRLEQYFEKQGIENIEVNEPFYIDFVQALTEADVYLGRNEVPVFDIFEVDVPFKVYKPKSSKGTLEDFKPIVGNDDLRPVMSGVYVDNGRLVATDAHVLIHYKDNEFKEYDEKIINLDTYIKSKGRSITFIEGKFPDYDRVIPKKENQKVIKDVNVLALLNYLTGVKALRKNIRNNIFQVVIQFDKETTIAFQSDLLYDALNFIVQKGYEVVEIGYEAPNRAITIYYPKGVALVMPVMIYSEEGTSSGSKKITLENILDEYSSENQMVKTKEKAKKINEKIDVVQEWQDTITTLQELLNEEGVSAQDKEEWEMTIATLEELLKEQKMELGGLVMSYSSPQIVEGIGSFTSQFDGGGVTRKVSKYSILEPNYGENKYTIWNSTYGDIMYGFKTREEAQEYIDNLIKNPSYAKGGLIAPNGNESNLTAEQYKLVRTKAFKDWFGDWENDPANASKVVDENGEPMVVYHGTKGSFNKFKKQNTYFTDSKKYIKNLIGKDAEIKEVFIYSKKVCDLTMLGFREISFAKFTNECVKQGAKKNYADYEELEDYVGNDKYMVWQFFRSDEPYLSMMATNWLEYFFDVIIYKNSGLENSKSKTWLFLSSRKNKLPNQIKLADGSNTTFDGSNPDIRFDYGGEVSGYVDLSKQKGMVVNDSGKLKELPIIDIVKKNTITTYPKVINGASVVYDMMKDLYGDSIRSYESFYAIMLDKANKPIYIYEHSKGGLDATIGDVQLIMATANKTLAKGIVLVHNHPSGNLTASEQDKILTKKVGNACKFFGIVLLDHLIITENGYTSFAEEGIDLAKDGIKVQDGESEEDNLSYAEAQERWNKKAGIPSQQDAIKFVKDNPEILMALEDGGKVFDPNQYELRLEDGDIIKEGKSFKDAFNDMIRLGIFDDKSKKKTNREKIEEAKNKLKAKN